MFEHFDFLLDNSNILLSRPSLRGSTPLDVAYSSLMENTELALALREHYLEKIAIYLSRCGLQSNTELVEKVCVFISFEKYYLIVFLSRVIQI